MARGRMISQSVSTDKRLNELTIEAQLVFLMTIPHLDRDGLLLADAPILAGKVCPRREDLRPLMESIIGQWIQLGMVISYESEDGTILFFTGFAKNQAGMRYDREPKSTLPPPPGYIRTKDGLELQPPSAPAPSSNGNVPPASGNLPTNGRQSADNLPPEENRSGNRIEEKGDRARAEAMPHQPAPPPPPVYRTEPSNGEYIPGVRRPQSNQTKRNCDTYMARASTHNVGAEPFRLMVDAVLTATGKIALANTNGDLGQATLNQAKETVVTLLEMGRRTLEDVQAVLTSWREHDYRGHSPPTFLQIVEHASAMAAGTHITKRRQESGKKDFASLAEYNEWARYNDPEYQRIREGIIVKGTTVKRTDYRPALAH